MKALSIGWDVGGWQGNNHGFALIVVNDREQAKLIKNPKTLSIPKFENGSGGLFELEDIIAEVSKGKVDLHDYDKIVIAVDAPLGFPNSFKEFINASDCIVRRPDSEINNPLAYRQTERHIYNAFGKKPLSAPFGRLGTSMTVAMVHARHWAGKGFGVMPKENVDNGRAIIETYPAIICEEVISKLRSEGIKSIDLSKKGHERDAVVCAIVGLCYLDTSIPASSKGYRLYHPEDCKAWNHDQHAEEGWIYYIGSKDNQITTIG